MPCYDTVDIDLVDRVVKEGEKLGYDGVWVGELASKETFEQKLEIFRSYCSDVRRNFDSIEKSIETHIDNV